AQAWALSAVCRSSCAMSESLISIDARRNGRAFASLTARGGGLPVGGTDVAGGPPLLHGPLLAAFPPVDEAVPEGFARARDPPGFVAVILGVIVFEHGLNLEIRLPTDVRWVDVRDADAPLLLGQTCDGGACLRRLTSQRAAAAIGERPRIGRVLENGEHGGHTRSLPDQIAEAVTAGQQQGVGVEHLDDFTG